MATPYTHLVLDAYPLSNAAVSLAMPGSAPTSSEQCRQWMDDCQAAGILLLVPAIGYYEEVRELYQRNAIAKIRRFERFCFDPTRYIPLTRNHLTEAAKLWAQVRQSGNTTADRHALDGDAILAAQTLSLNLPATQYAVITRNPDHLQRFGLPTDQWENIIP